MPIRDDTHAYRRILPHLLRRERTYYVTFCTIDRHVLPAEVRDVVLSNCIRKHDRLYWLDCVTVMPDHVHLIVTPFDVLSLERLLGRIKGASARAANVFLGRSGPLWQQESFDRIARKGDFLAKKRLYILENPVRAGLVSRWEDYPWSWTWEGGIANGRKLPDPAQEPSACAAMPGER
jgi:putative transposase